MEQKVQESYEVLLNDPENDVQYTLHLNYEDYVRSQTDEAFVHALLFHARCNRNTRHENVTRKNEDNNIVESPLQQKENDNEESCGLKTLTIWTYNQTRDLIQSMGNHYEDLNHPRKRKHVCELITNDLISNGYNVNMIMVQNKWRSLMRSYNKAKDSKQTTGVGPTRFQFYDLLDDILGDKPTNSCNPSLNSIENIPTGLLQTTNSSSSTNSPKSNENDGKIVQKSNKRTSNKTLEKEFLELKKEEYHKRQKRHDERVQLLKEKMALDNKKLELLQLFLQQK